jgi:hypothetical protein
MMRRAAAYLGFSTQDESRKISFLKGLALGGAMCALALVGTHVFVGAPPLLVIAASAVLVTTIRAVWISRRAARA